MNLFRFVCVILAVFVCGFTNLHAQPLASRTNDSALQEWCSDQAKRVFKQLGLGPDQGTDYRNHYNVKLHVCFMALETRRGKTITKTLLDAYAQHTYASYFAMENAPSLSQCTLMPPALEKRDCDSDREYEAFVTHYIE